MAVLLLACLDVDEEYETGAGHFVFGLHQKLINRLLTPHADDFT